MKAKGERRGWRSAEQRKKAAGDRQKERMEGNEEVTKEKKIKLEIRTGQKDNIKVNADENVTGEHQPSPKPSHLPPQRLLVLLPLRRRRHSPPNHICSFMCAGVNLYY